MRNGLVTVDVRNIGKWSTSRGCKVFNMSCSIMLGALYVLLCAKHWFYFCLARPRWNVCIYVHRTCQWRIAVCIGCIHACMHTYIVAHNPHSLVSALTDILFNGLSSVRHLSSGPCTIRCIHTCDVGRISFEISDCLCKCDSRSFCQNHNLWDRFNIKIYILAPIYSVEVLCTQ